MPLVLDASMAASLVLPGESSQMAERLLASLHTDDEILVPCLWWYEITNILVQAVRRRRLDPADMVGARTILQNIPLVTDSRGDWTHQSELSAIAERYGLTSYDAAYLELAVRRKAGLASCDDALIAACKKAGVPVNSPR